MECTTQVMQGRSTVHELMCDSEATRDVHVAEVCRIHFVCRTHSIGLASHATALPFQSA